MTSLGPFLSTTSDKESQAKFQGLAVSTAGSPDALVCRQVPLPDTPPLGAGAGCHLKSAAGL